MFRDRLSSERGAALVEFAMSITLLMMILMGTITMGITHNDNLSIETAARESARFGATYPVDDAGSVLEWLQDVGQTAQDAATGSLDPGVDGRVICVAQGSGSTSAGFTRIRVTGNSTVSSAGESPSWCFENTAPNDDVVVQVQLQREGWIQVIVFESTPTLTGQATSRFERAA
jgi:Flp pilus assembly protein TadG